jgi:hypothetical protein
MPDVPPNTPSVRVSPADEMRLFAAFAVQPFVAALMAFAAFPVVDYTGRSLYGGRPIDPADAALSFAFGTGVVALLVTIFAAFPLVMWLLTRGPLARAQTLIAGGILGNLPAIVILLALVVQRSGDGVGAGSLWELTYGPAGAVRALTIGSCFGLAGAAVFWRLAGRRLSGRT